MSLQPASHPLADRKPSESEDQHSLRITLSEEQKEHIISSEEFSAFIERSSRVMERALADTSDILFDLTSERKLESEGCVEGGCPSVCESRLVFTSQRWTEESECNQEEAILRPALDPRKISVCH